MADHHTKRQRQCMRERLLSKGAETLTELEILEMLLFAGQPRGDTKSLAKSLMRQFGSLAAVLRARVQRLADATRSVIGEGRDGVQRGSRGDADVADGAGGLARALGPASGPAARGRSGRAAARGRGGRGRTGGPRPGRLASPGPRAAGHSPPSPPRSPSSRVDGEPSEPRS